MKPKRKKYNQIESNNACKHILTLDIDIENIKKIKIK